MHRTLLLAAFFAACGGSEPAAPEPTPAPEPAAEPAPAPAPAPAANSTEVCEAAATVKGALMAASGHGMLGADARAALVSECVASWTAARASCLSSATTWDQVEACEK